MSRRRPDPRRVVRAIYRGLDGFDVPETSEAVVYDRRSSPVYGEIMPTATVRLLEHLRLNSSDVLYDLGSGVGKLVLHAAVRQPLTRIVGIELVEPRHRMAQEALSRARETNALRTEHVEFLKQDFMRTPLWDATVVYSCSTAFPGDLMRRLTRRLSKLDRGARFVSLQDIDDNPWFRLEHVLNLDMSWSKQRRVHIYRRR